MTVIYFDIKKSKMIALLAVCLLQLLGARLLFVVVAVSDTGFASASAAIEYDDFYGSEDYPTATPSLASSSSVFYGNPTIEINALEAFYNSTGGGNWSWPYGLEGRWNFTVADPQPCSPTDTWQGLECLCSNTSSSSDFSYDYSCSVMYLQIDDFNLNGFIPCGITNLSNLEFLELSANPYLTGTLPPCLADLKSLEYFFIDSNGLSGSIPDVIGDMSSLITFYVSDSLFTGSIPETVCHLINLQNFYVLGDPFITGHIPECLGNMSSLEILSIEDSGLSGCIPESIGLLGSTLTSLLLNDNLLTGSLPASITNLTLITLLSVETNKLTGTIPKDIGNLKYLYSLALPNNRITGQLPDSISQCDGMLYIDISSNMLTGSLPSAYGSMSSLRGLTLYNNRLSGSISDTYCQLSDLQYIYFGQNMIEGSIPACVGKWKHLVELYLGYNSFTGSLPLGLSNVSNTLSFIELRNNHFSGEFPEFVCNLHNLLGFDLQQNSFSGTVPACIGYMGNVFYGLNFLYLSSNHFSGTVPHTLANLDQLDNFQIDSNILTGQLPDWLFRNMSFVEELYLNSNAFSGTIPRSISKIKSLVTLQLQDNKFTGTMDGIIDPTSQLQLEVLQVSSNRLSGTVPADIFFLGNLSVFACGTNCLSGPLPVDAICNGGALSLQSLLLDGLHTAISCRKPVLGGLIPGVYALSPHTNIELDACFLSIPSLQVLHMSGNGLRSSFPHNTSKLLAKSGLKSLVLSYNSMHGRIPISIQNRSWQTLDLSFNHFTGTLDSRGDGFTNTFDAQNTSLKLRVNRLSGKIPDSLTDAHSLEILDGNMFSCDYGGTTLPVNDKERRNYSCGSDSFNALYYLWLSLISVGLVCIALGWLAYNRPQNGSGIDDNLVSTVSKSVATVREWSRAVTEADSSIVVSGSYYCEKEKGGGKRNNNSSGTGQNVANVGRVFNSARMVAMYCCAYGLFVLMPIYFTCSVYYGTYTYQYAWLASASFLNGPVPWTVIYIALVGLMCTFVLVGRYQFLKATSALLADESTNSGSSSMKSSSSSNCGSNGIGLRKEEEEEEEGILPTTSDRTKANLLHAFCWFTIIVVNGIVVVLANVGFVYVSVYNGNDVYLFFAQWSLAVFKYFWNTKVLRWIANRILSLREDVAALRVMKAVTTLELFATLFNNIIVPCLVVMAVDPDCFYNFLVAADPVRATYQYMQCLEYSYIGIGISECELYTVATGTTSFDPPFTYSYECSSRFVTYYAGTFLYFCMLAGLVMPALQWLVYYALQKNVDQKEEEEEKDSFPSTAHFWRHLFFSKVPRILKPVNKAEIRAIFAPEGEKGSSSSSTTTAVGKTQDRRKVVFFDSVSCLIMLTTLLGLLLTFGTVFPPLGFALTVTIISFTYFTQVKLGRLICALKKQNLMQQEQQQALEMIDKECAVFHLSATRWGWVFATISCCFYSFALFDTLGQSIHKSWWVFLITCALPFIIVPLSKLLLPSLTEKSTALQQQQHQQQQQPAGAIIANHSSSSSTSNNSNSSNKNCSSDIDERHVEMRTSSMVLHTNSPLF